MTRSAMTTFVLIPGAGGSAWYWHRIVPMLERANYAAIPVDLPGDHENAGLNDYADIVVRAIGSHDNVIVVAQSLGGFTAPLVCARCPVRMLVLVNAMIPLPGETAGDWWPNTGVVQYRVTAAKRGGYNTEFDIGTYFLHDVPKDVLQDGAAQVRDQAETVFAQPCQFDTWPDIPTHVVAGADDRFFPLAFQQQVAQRRLNKAVDVLRGGHLVALSNPSGLVGLLRTFERELDAKSATSSDKSRSERSARTRSH